MQIQYFIKIIKIKINAIQAQRNSILLRFWNHHQTHPKCTFNHKGKYWVMSAVIAIFRTTILVLSGGLNCLPLSTTWDHKGQCNLSASLTLEVGHVKLKWPELVTEYFLSCHEKQGVFLLSAVGSSFVMVCPQILVCFSLHMIITGHVSIDRRKSKLLDAFVCNRLTELTWNTMLKWLLL